MFKLASLASVMLLALVCVPGALADPVYSTYTFNGTCGDCTGSGTGTLTLVGYSPGQTIDTSNFFSFTYTSNLTSFTISGAPYGIFGSMPSTLSTLPGFASFGIIDSGRETSFHSGLTGYWCSGGGCAEDYGTNGVWSAADASVPEPGTIGLALAGLTGLGILRRKR